MAPEYSPHSVSRVEWDYRPNLWTAKGLRMRLNQSSLFKYRELQVQIHHHYTSKIYTSGSSISGDVVIAPRKDVSFDKIKIALVGRSRVRRRDVELSYEASQVFLEIDMPIPRSSLPASSKLRAGNTYTIPFHFVIPHQLASSACTHRVESQLIRNLHTRMPPSTGCWEGDDMTPDMAKIEYGIKAAVISPTEDGGFISSMVGNSHLINFLPVTPEDPPLDISEHDAGYTLSRSKMIRKNPLSAPEGRLAISAQQPRPIMFSTDAVRTCQSILPLQLAFDAVNNDCSLPKTVSVSAKLQAETWYHDRPMMRLPQLGSGRGAFSITTSLFSQSDIKVTWKCKRGGQGSSNSFTSLLAIHFQYQDEKKVFLPTFHACLLSRTYKLRLSVRVGTSTFKLVVPVQVAFRDGDQVGFSGDEASADISLRDDADIEGEWFGMEKLSIQASLPRYEETA